MKNIEAYKEYLTLKMQLVLNKREMFRAMYEYGHKDHKEMYFKVYSETAISFREFLLKQCNLN